jgi:hypothetical protein
MSSSEGALFSIPGEGKRLVTFIAHYEDTHQRSNQRETEGRRADYDQIKHHRTAWFDRASPLRAWPYLTFTFL